MIDLSLSVSSKAAFTSEAVGKGGAGEKGEEGEEGEEGTQVVDTLFRRVRLQVYQPILFSRNPKTLTSTLDLMQTKLNP